MSQATASPATISGSNGRMVEANGIRLHCKVGGNPAGPPMLLWHGFLGTSYTWRKVAPLLATRGCAVLVPDMRGYGDSDKPSGPEGYDGLSLAADFRALVRETGFGAGRPITLIAHDMGVNPALLWAAQHPGEVAGLALMEEPVLLPDVLAKLIAYTPEGTKLGGLWWWMMALAPSMAECLVAGGHERAFLEWNYQHYAADPQAIEPAAVDEYLRSFAAADGVPGAFGIYRAVPRSAEQTAPLARAKLRVPVLDEGELILAIEIPSGPRARRSAYAKAPPAGGFALASAAVALEIVEGRVASACVALGGIAHKPWRSAETEATLLGRAPDRAAFRGAADAALAAARPLPGNTYKVPLARAVLEEAVAKAAAGAGT